MNMEIVANEKLDMDQQTLPDAGLERMRAMIGSTPLIPLTRLDPDLAPDVQLLAKGEFLNPSGSVKDRPAFGIIEDGFRRGLIGAGQTLLDATSGNMGIAYAMIGAATGIPVRLALPSNATRERKQILRAFGAEILETDPMEGSDGAREIAREIAKRSPERYYYPDQYNNDANWKAHFDGTGVEILSQTDGAVSHFVAGIGTSGTFVGVARRLQEYDPAIESIAVQPDSPLHGLEGLKHLATAVTPGIFDSGLVDETLVVSTDDAHQMVKDLARREGLLVGVSAGANVVAALRVARSLTSGVVVTVLCDSGSRYLSTPMWKLPQKQ
jgi:cysteine synthase B